MSETPVGAFLSFWRETPARPVLYLYLSLMIYNKNSKQIRGEPLKSGLVGLARICQL